VYVGLDHRTDHREPWRDLHRPYDCHGGRGEAAKDPNEIALTILLVALTLASSWHGDTVPYSLYSVEVAKLGTPITITALVALLVCLIPTTIGGLLSAIGVAGMSRMMQANVIATSGRAVEAAGDVDVLLLDKTGTITLGNRQAATFIPASGVTEEELANTRTRITRGRNPEGRSVRRTRQNNVSTCASAISARSPQPSCPSPPTPA